MIDQGASDQNLVYSGLDSAPQLKFGEHHQTQQKSEAMVFAVFRGIRIQSLTDAARDIPTPNTDTCTPCVRVRVAWRSITFLLPCRVLDRY